MSDRNPWPSRRTVSSGAEPLESTASLLEKLRGGDQGAREQLLSRYLPLLSRWAHGRLPPYARDLLETDDVVQLSLLRSLKHLESFEPRHEGALLAYLRRSVLNSVRDEIRRAGRQPAREALNEEMANSGPSLLEEVLGREALEAYEAGLERLPEGQQEAVILRVEMGWSYQEIAEAVGSPSANAVRMTISRALVRLAEMMDERSR
jgi:RNA polymerase sigma-70 factor, ECF subfamily